MDYLRFIMKMITITGALMNIIGSIILYRSVKSSQSNLEGIYVNRGKEIHPVALLDKELAKRGIGFIILGFFIQFLVILS